MPPTDLHACRNRARRQNHSCTLTIFTTQDMALRATGHSRGLCQLFLRRTRHQLGTPRSRRQGLRTLTASRPLLQVATRPVFPRYFTQQQRFPGAQSTAVLALVIRLASTAGNTPPALRLTLWQRQPWLQGLKSKPCLRSSNLTKMCGPWEPWIKSSCRRHPPKGEFVEFRLSHVGEPPYSHHWFDM